MYSGRLVFSQVMDHLPMKTFRRCVQRYHGNRHIQSFTCLDQFLCMAFAQLTYRESLCDIEVCLRAHRDKLYHMGIRGGMSTQHPGQRESAPGLAHLRRIRAGHDSHRPPPVCRRGPGARSRQHRLRTGRIHRRPVPVGLSMGVVPAPPSPPSSCTRCWTCRATSRRSFTSLTGRCTT